MPFYHAIVRPGVLDVEDRQALANDVTTLHCDVTGAPRTLVHVLLTIDDANRLPRGIDCSYRANIRSGRTPAQKDELAARLRMVTADRTNAAVSGVAVEIEETEASPCDGGRPAPPGTGHARGTSLELSRYERLGAP